jgi:L-alanine-DL-glutamate epimerase-like enolase superfamily enzyme
MSIAYDRLAELPLEIDSYELSGHDREYGEFTRPSTVIHLRGGGKEGIGEDVVYDVLDHIAHRDAGPVLDLTGPETLGQACELLGKLDLFPGAPPEREPSRHYRRWAYESAALDLALRQNGLALWEVVERDPQPLRFVCSTRLGGFGENAAKSTTEPIKKRLERYPELEFKLDPENDWDANLIDEIAALAPVRILDLKGMYKGTPVDVDTDPALYRAVAEKFPDAYLEDPDLEHEGAREVLDPHADRVTWDAPLHSLADVKKMARKAINSKPSRFGSLEELLAIYEYCEANEIAVYGGGQGEVECGRGQIQYLASLFHSTTPNDVAPSGYNDPAVPAGMPNSPMDPAQSEIGFRWGER